MVGRSEENLENYHHCRIMSAAFSGQRNSAYCIQLDWAAILYYPLFVLGWHVRRLAHRKGALSSSPSCHGCVHQSSTAKAIRKGTRIFHLYARALPEFMDTWRGDINRFRGMDYPGFFGSYFQAPRLDGQGRFHRERAQGRPGRTSANEECPKEYPLPLKPARCGYNKMIALPPSRLPTTRRHHGKTTSLFSAHQQVSRCGPLP